MPQPTGIAFSARIEADLMMIARHIHYASLHLDRGGAASSIPELLHDLHEVVSQLKDDTTALEDMCSDWAQEAAR
ncbi:hypothetical protein [Beijerinckia sp. L45]|uniref:hypothetical protein n=1 Tax=Beijerinckia sp. L45 TaxID=1641855 RepID=UPI00131E7EE9|nr:hypothetical protein [Beijerinckia sp. L45]